MKGVSHKLNVSITVWAAPTGGARLKQAMLILAVRRPSLDGLKCEIEALVNCCEPLFTEPILLHVPVLGE